MIISISDLAIIYCTSDASTQHRRRLLLLSIVLLPQARAVDLAAESHSVGAPIQNAMNVLPIPWIKSTRLKLNYQTSTQDCLLIIRSTTISRCATQSYLVDLIPISSLIKVFSTLPPLKTATKYVTTTTRA